MARHGLVAGPLLLAGGFLLCASGCASEEGKSAVLLRVRAQGMVATRVRCLRFELQGRAADGDWGDVRRRAERVEAWPVHGWLRPSGQDASRRFLVVVRGYASTVCDGAPLVAARVESGWVEGASRLLEVWLLEACLERPACGQPDPGSDCPPECAPRQLASEDLPAIGPPGDGGLGDAAEPECRSADECLDEFACTQDRCVAGRCVHDADHSACDSGKYCDPMRGCVACLRDADCAAGAPPCIVPRCIEGVCDLSEPKPDGTDCTDPTDCTTGVCAAGMCQATGPSPDGNACSDDDVPETEDACMGGVCRHYRTFRDVVAWANNTCAVETSGRLWCWGKNGSGQLGQGNTDVSNGCPQPLPASWAVVRAAAVGERFACAVDGAGQLWCWGNNGAGQVGQGMVTLGSPLPSPQEVMGLADVQSVAAGLRHACAVDGMSRLWCWGGNGSGQLGQGTTGMSQPSPQEVMGLTNVRSVAAGATHTCAVDGMSRLWCWGGNGSGQLGQGNQTTPQPSPQDVMGLANVRSVAAGAAHTCAVDGMGRLWCWGGNGSGQLGQGNQTTPQPSPQEVMELTDVQSVAAGLRHTCAVDGMGRLWCWGDNGSGQLGLGGSTAHREPALVDTSLCP